MIWILPSERSVLCFVMFELRVVICVLRFVIYNLCFAACVCDVYVVILFFSGSSFAMCVL